jgi:ABC-2 type transport system permease protein
MKLAVLRHSTTDAKMALSGLGWTAGICLAVTTVALAFFDFSHPRLLMDLLAVTFALWALGWMVGPIFAGEPALNGEHFHRQPIPRRTLAMGLLAAALVAVTTAITLAAFGALVVFAARLNWVAVVVSVPAVVLLLLLVVLLSRVVTLLFRSLARSRVGGAVTATVTAAMVSLCSFSWVLLIGVYLLLEYGFPPAFSTVVRALPSSWGLLAVEAAGRGDWLWTVGPLVALAVVVVLLFLAWSALLGPQRLARPVIRGSSAQRAVRRGRLLRGDQGAIYLKELRTWWRDPVRTQGIVMGPAFSIITVLFPLIFGFTAGFPFVGAASALMAAATCANPYGQDGTALWLTLTVPGKEKADVRARQLAWLTVFGPLTLVLTLVGCLLHGDASLVPWALAATFAALGGGSGLLIWVSVVALVPGPDPHKSKNSPMDHGDVTGQSFLMFFLVALAMCPALGVAWAGQALDLPVLLWASVPVGLLTGVLCHVLLGTVAAGELRDRGPDLLHLMRSGAPAATSEEPGETTGKSPFETLSGARQTLMWSCGAVGILGLFPQGLVPLAIKLNGSPDKVWFLALHVPEPWQWPVIAIMIVIGLAGFRGAHLVYRGEKRRLKAAADAPRGGDDADGGDGPKPGPAVAEDNLSRA